MSGYLLLLVSLLALHSSLALKNLDEPRWKSFSDAELACANYLLITNETLQRYHSSGYPNERSVWKLMYCIFIELHAWNENRQEVKDYVFSQFFIPSTTDCQYKQHTEECLDQNVKPLNTTDTLGRAYQTFQCYYQNYAGISDEVKWIPYHFSEIVQTDIDCMHIESLSPESLLDFCQGRVASNPDYPALAYCFFVRTGIYNKTTGMDLEKLYVQFGSKPLLHEHTKLCVAEVAEQYCKEPERIGHILLDCLIQYLPATLDIGTAASDALGNPPECVILPSPPPKTQPCYNGPCV
ncbi:general odorant-binding protein 69-like [Ochlerotatus camptorhynchus]|uniref:general odorant-binding protein 69-like n=1 Tax=Ochlerotatus camptorhynchus TaxID=644619 RepID=UPI0031E18A48